MSRTLGIDIGGTNTKYALLDGDRVLDTGSVPTDRSGSTAAVQRATNLAVRQLAANADVERVGITIPGHFDTEGRATVVPNIPGEWFGEPVRSVVQEASALPVTLINDARACGLAESRIGAATGAATVVFLVLGTGVGGAVVIGGRLLQGTSGLAGEIGHTVLDSAGPSCGCGNNGCLEALVRSDRLAERAGAASVADAVAAAQRGDDRALSAIAEAGQWMGLALANVANLLAPDVIVVGGGIAAAGATLFDPLRAEFAVRTPLIEAASVRIEPAMLGTYAGSVGAAFAAADASTP